MKHTSSGRKNSQVKIKVKVKINQNQQLAAHIHNFDNVEAACKATKSSNHLIDQGTVGEEVGRCGEGGERR
jgi:hypothetical protein